MESFRCSVGEVWPAFALGGAGQVSSSQIGEQGFNYLQTGEQDFFWKYLKQTGEHGLKYLQIGEQGLNICNKLENKVSNIWSKLENEVSNICNKWERFPDISPGSWLRSPWKVRWWPASATGSWRSRSRWQSVPPPGTGWSRTSGPGRSSSLSPRANWSASFPISPLI